MNSRLYPIALPLIAAAMAASASDQSQAITVTVGPAMVEVTPAAAGRRFLILPDLEYQLLLEPRCSGDAQVSGLSLSVADSRLRITAEQLAEPVIEAQLTVPAAQLAPLPIKGFCELPDPDKLAAAAGEPLIISAAASLQASLLCVGKEQQRMTYSAAALDVELRCKPLETTPAEPVESQ